MIFDHFECWFLGRIGWDSNPREDFLGRTPPVFKTGALNRALKTKMADETKAEQVQLPIDWHISSEVITRYANNLVVQNTGFEFVVSFFETIPPIILGEPSTEQLEKLESIRSECIARVVIAAERMPSFLEVLKTNYDRHVERRQREDTE